jgi:flagellar protein FliO/FliZ
MSFTRKARWLIPSLILALLPTAVAIAATVQPGGSSQIPASPSTLGGLLQVLFGLVIVLGAVAGTAWILRRLGPGQMRTSAGSVRIVGGVMVGPKERLVMVEVGETWLLLGVAPGQVSTLHTLPKPPVDVSESGSSLPEPGFAAWLKRATQRRQNG